MGLKFDDFVNAIGDADSTEEIKALTVPVAVSVEQAETPLDMVDEPSYFNINLTEDTLAVADHIGVAREKVEVFHEYITSEFSEEFKVASEQMHKYWKNEKLDDKEYNLFGEVRYTRYLQKFVSDFTDFICGRVDSYHYNLMVKSPHGFLKKELVGYLQWLVGLYRSGFGDMSKDKWVLAQKQAPAVTTLDIYFLKENMINKSDEYLDGCNLYDIYNSPLLCVYLCGDVRIDSEIVHEIYTYRSVHMQNALSCFVVICPFEMKSYNRDSFFGGIWKEIVVSIDGDKFLNDEKQVDTRLHSVYCYFKSNKDAVKPIGIDSQSKMELVKSLF